MSALNSKDIEVLHERLVRFFMDNMTQVDLVVSYGKEECSLRSAKTFTCGKSPATKEECVSRSKQVPVPLPL
jgi:hypothetical protein